MHDHYVQPDDGTESEYTVTGRMGREGKGEEAGGEEL